MTNNSNQCEQKYFHEKNICYFCDKFKNIRQENMFFIFSCCYFMYYVFKWIEKWIILKSNYFSKYKKKKLMTHLYFLSIDNNYKNHMFLNLISKIQFKKKWVKTQILINNKCKSTNTIDMRYIWKHYLKIQKFQHNMILKNFNTKITLITHMIIIKLWFDKHIKYVELYIHNLKNKYNMILEFNN